MIKYFLEFFLWTCENKWLKMKRHIFNFRENFLKIENFIRCMWRTESFSLNKNLSFDEYFLIESQLDEVSRQSKKLAGRTHF